MFLKRLIVDNFRSFSHFDVSFASKKNYIVGENAVGKTSVLEAIYFQSIGRSFLRSNTKAMIKNGENITSISSVFEKNKKEHIIESSIIDETKSFKYDGEKVKNISEIIKQFIVFYFNPESVYFFKNEPSIKRKLFDVVLCQIKDNYLYALKRYKKILKERNAALLKNYDQDIINVLAGELSNLSYIIVNERKSAVSYINNIIQSIYSRIYGSEKKVALVYKTNLPIVASKEEFIEKTAELFEKHKSYENINRMTIIGPHRDNFVLYLDDKDVSIYASQGENRIASFSLKLALHDYVTYITKQIPIFLLDDVLSDLDEIRRRNLLSIVGENTQVFITGVNEIGLKEYDVYKIENSNIRRIN